MIPFSNKKPDNLTKKPIIQAEKPEENYQKSLQKYKFWRYTKKFDVNLKSLIRNTSALSKIYLEGVKNREEPIELAEYKQDEQEIEENVQTFMKQNSENKNIYKQMPSDKEKTTVFQGFKESIKALKSYEAENYESFIRKKKIVKKPEFSLSSNKKELPINRIFINNPQNVIIENWDKSLLSEEETKDLLRKLKGSILKPQAKSKELLKKEAWDQFLRPGDCYNLLIMDIRSMKMIEIPSVFIIGDELKSLQGDISFEALFKGVASYCEEMDKFQLYEPLVYIGVYNEEMEVLYEKFRLVGEWNVRNEEKIVKAVLKFYLRVLLMFDREKRRLQEIKENSELFLESN